jgi:formylglycine-generating enzyme required for sulfatase activity
MESSTTSLLKPLLITMFVIMRISAFGQLSTSLLPSIQKKLKKIDEKLYASATEVTNHEYQIFIDFLKKNQSTENLAIAQIDSAQWRREFAYNEPFVRYYHAHPAYQDYPVVNVSYEGTLLYCEWLTTQYNTHPKRNFNKVQFRLPTEQEWVKAAQGGNASAIYPWEGDQLKNKKGMYRCNFIRAAEDTMGVAGFNNDNADITAPVKSYEPNTFGLYNMSGNVAEMLFEKGKTKGGSWQDAAEAMKIASNGKFGQYSQPCPAIGFRVFMEVLEK